MDWLTSELMRCVMKLPASAGEQRHHRRQMRQLGPRRGTLQASGRRTLTLLICYNSFFSSFVSESLATIALRRMSLCPATAVIASRRPQVSPKRVFSSTIPMLIRDALTYIRAWSVVLFVARSGSILTNLHHRCCASPTMQCMRTARWLRLECKKLTLKDTIDRVLKFVI